jgi:hypothetical protein
MRQEDTEKLEKINLSYETHIFNTVKEEMNEFTCGPIKIRKLSDVIAPFSIQMSMLMWRTIIFSKREPQAVIARIGSSVFLSLL